MWSLVTCRTRTAAQTLDRIARLSTTLRRSLWTPRSHCIHAGRTRASYTRQDTGRWLLDTEPVVQKDTLLYRNDNKKFFRFMNYFGVSQFFFWSYLSHFAYTTMKSVQIPEEQKQDNSLPWWKRTDFGQYRNGITIFSFMVGWGTMALCWMYTLRSVSALVLKRGGRELLFVTFAPFGRSKSMLVPLEKVSAKQSRISSSVHLPLKVQGKSFHYLIDMKGHFTNSKLFDYSAGLKRSWAR